MTKLKYDYSGLILQTAIFLQGGIIMATTRIMPLHVGKGRTESRAIVSVKANGDLR